MEGSNVTASYIMYRNLTLRNDDACYEVDAADNEHVWIAMVFSVYMSLALVFLGLIGNTLSIVVFSSAEMRVVSSNNYLLVLAISDSLYLISVLMTKLLTTLRCIHFPLSSVDMYNRNDFMCKLLQFVLDFFSDYSTCLVMVFTVERFIAVFLPLKFKELCTVRRARLVCVFMLLLVCGLIAPYHFMYMGRPTNYDVCTVLPEYEAEFTILYVLEALIFRVLPVFIIAVFNIFIIVRIGRLAKQKRRLKQAQGPALAALRKRNHKEERNMQLTITLILVSTTYVLVYIPVLVHFVMWKMERAKALTINEHLMAQFHYYSRTLYILGFAVNFLLYTIGGRVFRQQLRTKLCSGSGTMASQANGNHGKNGITAANTERAPICCWFRRRIAQNQQPATFL